MDRTFKILVIVGVVVLGFIVLGALNWERLSEWEPNAARSITAEVLGNFSAPCQAKNVDLSCDAQVNAMPRGSYSFVTVDTMPFEGVFVRVRFTDGKEVELEVFPSLVRRNRARITRVTP